MARSKLNKIFANLVKAFPDRTDNARPIGMGFFGIVIDHNDSTVSKFIRRDENLDNFEMYLQGFYREITILELLKAKLNPGINFPELVGHSEELYTNEFAATYRMTKIEGAASTTLLDRRCKVDFSNVYQKAGAIAAKFHSIDSEGFPDIPNRNGYDGQSVTVVPGILSDRTNNALLKVNQYLQEHRTQGLVHGDLGFQNLIYKNNIPIGLVDFSFTGQANNQAADFCLIPENYLPDFIHGYEEQTGINLNRDLIRATRLGFSTNQLSMLRDPSPMNDKYRLDMIEQINVDLNKLTYVTGFKP